MRQSNELQVGKAGEYLVCADLILAGHIAYLSEQGLPYDVVLDTGRLYRIQVKTTNQPRKTPQRAKASFAYIFNIQRHGNGNNLRRYDLNEVDIFALVAVDSRIIAYLPNGKMKTTMNFRVPSLRGSYYDEQGVKLKQQVLDYKESGLDCPAIAEALHLSLSNVYRYSADVDITPKGNNHPVYFDEFSLDKCLSSL